MLCTERFGPICCVIGIGVSNNAVRRHCLDQTLNSRVHIGPYRTLETRAAELNKLQIFKSLLWSQSQGTWFNGWLTRAVCTPTPPNKLIDRDMTARDKIRVHAYTPYSVDFLLWNRWHAYQQAVWSDIKCGGCLVSNAINNALTDIRTASWPVDWRLHCVHTNMNLFLIDIVN